MRALTTTLFALTLLGAIPAQAQGAEAQLQKAQLIEEQEGDLAAAERAYEALLQDDAAKSQHDLVAFRLGALRWRLGRKDEAEALLTRAAAANETLSAMVAALKAEQGEAAKAALAQADRAEELVKRYVEALEGSGPYAQTTQKHLRAELLGIREHAAAAIAQWLRNNADAKDARTVNGAGSGINSRRANFDLVPLLWELGTAPAVTYLEQTVTTGTTEWQTLVSYHSGSGEIPAELRPVLRDFSRLQHPYRSIWSNCVTTLSRQSAEVATSWLYDEHPATVEAGLTALQNKLANESGSLHAELAREQRDRLLQLYSADEAQLYVPACQLVHLLGTSDEPDCVALLLAALRRNPERAPEQLRVRFDKLECSSNLLRDLHTTADVLGPQPEDRAPSHAQHALTVIFSRCVGTRVPADVPLVLDLLEGGYGGTQNLTCALPAYEAATMAQRATILAHALSRENPQQLLSFAYERGVGAELFPVIRELYESDAPSFARFRNNWADAFLLMAGRSGHADSARWLGAQIDAEPKRIRYLANALAICRRAGPNDDADRALRRLLTLDADHTEDENALRGARGRAVVELARIGDPSVLEQLPHVITLGAHVDLTSIERPRLTDGEQDGASSQDLRNEYQSSFIRLLLEKADGTWKWHAYDAEQLAGLWRRLLQSDAAETIWTELNTGQGGTLEVSAIELPILAEALPGTPDVTRKLNAFFQRIRPLLVRTTVADLDASPELRAAVRALFGHDANFSAACFAVLPRDTVRHLAADGQAQLARTGSIHWLTVLSDRNIPIDVDSWRGALQSKDPAPAMYALPLDAPEELQPMLTELLRGEAPTNTRIAAIVNLTRVFPDRAPAVLLPLLREAEEPIRNTARDQLELLREAQEQRQFWARLSGGVDLSPQATSQKLVQQAMPNNDAAQRVLAIRSLAAVGATEALPLLIEWSQDEDTPKPVRDAANAAVNAILVRSEAGK